MAKSGKSLGDDVPLLAVGISAGYANSSNKTPLPLAGVDLFVRSGELVAILGPNGAGKTTLLRVLSGALAPRAGEVRLFGQPLAEMPRRAIAQQVAVVAQSEDVAVGFRVREVILMGRAPHQSGWMRASREDETIADDALARCDLTAHAERMVGELSGGEQKRVMIARALAQRPRVLLLDEPGAFLDVRHQIALYDLLVEEVSRARLACVIVMHDLNIAAQYATRVVLVKKGKLVAVGTVEEVMTEARLRETFETDLYVGRNELTNTLFFLPMRATQLGVKEFSSPAPRARSPR